MSMMGGLEDFMEIFMGVMAVIFWIAFLCLMGWKIYDEITEALAAKEPKA